MVALNLLSLTTTALLAASALAAPTTTPEKRDTDTASYTPPSGSGNFQLLLLPTKGNLDLGGLWVSSFHTGAGEAVPVMTANQSLAPSLSFNATTGDIYFLAGSPTSFPMSLGFLNARPYLSNATSGAKLTTFNAGLPCSEFSFDSVSNEVLVPEKYGRLLACPVNGTAPYFSVGPQVQLFWRKKEVWGKSVCADVKLKAIF